MLKQTEENKNTNHKVDALYNIWLRIVNEVRTQMVLSLALIPA